MILKSSWGLVSEAIFCSKKLVEATVKVTDERWRTPGSVQCLIEFTTKACVFFSDTSMPTYQFIIVPKRVKIRIAIALLVGNKKKAKAQSGGVVALWQFDDERLGVSNICAPFDLQRRLFDSCELQRVHSMKYTVLLIPCNFQMYLSKRIITVLNTQERDSITAIETIINVWLVMGKVPSIDSAE